VDAIMDDADVHGVFLSTTNEKLPDLTKLALQRGKHVFCEKPPALNASQISEIMEDERRAGTVLMYGFNHRQHESVGKMHGLISGGEFGKVLWMRGRYGKSVDEDFFSTWRSKKELAGGGILLDQGIHMLDLFLYLGGSFDDVKAYVSNLYWKIDEIEDNVFAILKNSKTGLVASLHSTMTQWRHLFSLEVFLEKGYMVLNGLKTSSHSYGEEVLSIARNRSSAPAATWEDEETFVFHTDKSMSKEVEIFIHHILDGSKVKSGGSADALAVMHLIDSIYQNNLDNRFGANLSLAVDN
jgi:predicted dehydrogenase